jgi:hypothetical protein
MEAGLMVLDQRLPDATTEETERGETCSGSPEGEKTVVEIEYTW